MLDQTNLTLALAKKTYQQIVPIQMERLLELERLVYAHKTPVIIVFEGWDAAGKGTTIRKLTERLDPRGFKVLPTNAPRTHEQQKPWLWRFWMQIPRHGQIAIFDRSWYGRVLVERVEGLTPIPEWIRAYEEINAFERTLAADQTVFMKFWLHISKAEQLRRFLYLSQQPELAWHVAAEDWEHHRKYDEYLAAVRDMLANTHTPVAPWTVVPATDANYRTYRVLRTVIERLESALAVEPMAWPALEGIAAEQTDQQHKKKAKDKTPKKTKGKKAENAQLHPDKVDKKSKNRIQKPSKTVKPAIGQPAPAPESKIDLA